jgi:Zn-dependent protease
VPTFSLFGFPVRVRWGFVVFIALVVAWNPTIGWKFAIAVSGFSLLHEFGHALAARSLGASPEIVLDFFAGSVRYLPPRHISPLERAGVALAGPGLQIVVGAAVLAGLRANPFDVPAIFDSQVRAVIWITGPVFALLNLLPVLPLDGGHVLVGALETFSLRRGHDLAVAASVALTLGLTTLTVAERRYHWLVPFAAFLLVLQLWPWWRRRDSPVRSRRTLPPPSGPSQPAPSPSSDPTAIAENPR